MVKKIYLANLAYLLIPLIIITLAIYLLGLRIYQQSFNERNLLQINHLIDYLNDGRDELQRLNLTEGQVILVDESQQIITGVGDEYQKEKFQEILDHLQLSTVHQGKRLEGYYWYHLFQADLDLTVFYLCSQKIFDTPIKLFRNLLILVFFLLVFAGLYIQKRTNAKIVEPMANLYQTVWNLMDGKSQMIAQQYADDEMRIIKAYLVQLQYLVQERDTKLRRNLFSVMDILIGLLEIKDSYTASHSRQVRKLSIAIAQIMGLDEQEIRDIAFAATLHDIGKIGVSGTILNKPGKLTSKEFSAIKQHPVVADNVLKNIDELENVRKIIRHHHENYDGTGYPDQLAKDEIPIAARIVSVADAFDAMTSDRPYRKALSHDHAMAILWRETGRQFDPQVVRALSEILSQQSLVSNGHLT